MKWKRLSAIATALAACALIAAPAHASKYLQPLHEGAPYTGDRTIHASGNAQFSNGLGGIAATLDITMTLSGGESAGEVTSVTVTNPSAFGLIGHCVIASASATGLPWTAHVEESTGGSPTKQISITDPEFSNTTTTGFLCPHELDVAGGTVVATPDNAGSIASVTLSGKVITTAGEASVTGLLTVSPEGTYGIG